MFPSGLVHESRNKAGTVSFIAGLPDNCNLINGDVAQMTFIIFQVQHAAVNAYDVTAQARGPAAKDIYLPPH
jgi:hypothetical protein